MATAKAPKNLPAFLNPADIRLAANVRTDPVDDEEQAEFEASVQAHGVVSAITVQMHPDGTPEVVIGQRRWRAANKFKQDSIPVQWKEYAEPEDNLALQMIENLQRSDMTVAETAAGVWDLYNGIAAGSQSVIAELLGKPKSWVSKMMKIGADVPDASNTVARDLLVNGKLSDADMASILCQIEELSLDEAKRLGKEISDYVTHPGDPNANPPVSPKGVQHTRKSLKVALDQLRAAQNGNGGDGDGEGGDDDGEGRTPEDGQGELPLSTDRTPAYAVEPEDYRMLAHLLREGTVPAKWLERKAIMLHWVESKLAELNAAAAD